MLLTPQYAPNFNNLFGKDWKSSSQHKILGEEAFDCDIRLNQWKQPVVKSPCKWEENLQWSTYWDFMTLLYWCFTLEIFSNNHLCLIRSSSLFSWSTCLPGHGLAWKVTWGKQEERENISEGIWGRCLFTQGGKLGERNMPIKNSELAKFFKMCN